MPKRRLRERPAWRGTGMRAGRWLAAALVPTLLSGCLTSFELRSDTLGVPPGAPSVGPRPGASRVIGGAVQLQGTGLGGAIITAAAVAAMIDDARETPARFSGPLMRRGAPPELDPARTIHEQDCTKPIEDPGANLRCR